MFFFFLSLFSASLDIEPKQKILDKLCIVTAADHNYFSLLKDLLDSIKKTKTYKNIPIYVYDLGLNKEEKDFLCRNYNIKGLKDPGWDVELSTTQPNHCKAMTARPFLNKHFPGYEYYLWIDSDTWVNKEFALNRFVNLAVKQGFSLCQEQFSGIFCKHRYNIMPFKDFLRTIFYKNLNSGVFCINPNFLNKWACYFRKTVKIYGNHFLTEQSTANFIYYSHNLKPLCESENYVTLDFGYPVLYKGVLKNPRTFSDIGIVHLACNKTVRKYQALVPILNTQKPLSFLAYVKHVWQSQKWHKNIPPTMGTPYTMISMKFNAQATQS